MNIAFSKIEATIRGATIPRHEYNLTQGACHKRNCPCHVTGNGNPEAAVRLIEETILDDLRHLFTFGETPLETDLKNWRDENE